MGACAHMQHGAHPPSGSVPIGLEPCFFILWMLFDKRTRQDSWEGLACFHSWSSWSRIKVFWSCIPSKFLFIKPVRVPAHEHSFVSKVLCARACAQWLVSTQFCVRREWMVFCEELQALLR